MNLFGTDYYHCIRKRNELQRIKICRTFIIIQDTFFQWNILIVVYMCLLYSSAICCQNVYKQNFIYGNYEPVIDGNCIIQY